MSECKQKSKKVCVTFLWALSCWFKCLLCEDLIFPVLPWPQTASVELFFFLLLRLFNRLDFLSDGTGHFSQLLTRLEAKTQMEKKTQKDLTLISTCQLSKLDFTTAAANKQTSARSLTAQSVLIHISTFSQMCSSAASYNYNTLQLMFLSN